jgi:gamma-glutamyltranspeptidase/glutathione hydrolase
MLLMKMKRTSRNVYTCLLAVCLVAAILVVPAGVRSQNAPGQAATSKEWMATTAHPLATEAAIQMLRKGGNAVDAAVAAGFAIGVVEPDGSGLGGGGGMVIYLAGSQRAEYINYYQQASGNVDDLSYTPATDSRTARSILVPGTVAGLTEALRLYGTLPLADVLAPAIRYAEEGFPIDETLGKILLDNADFLGRHPATAGIFLRDEFPLMAGDTLKQPDLARTLREIAIKGKAGFYEGPVAQAIVDEVTRLGGMLTMEDMASFKPVVTRPARGSYRGYELFSAQAPQAGASIIQGLQMLEQVDLHKLGHYAKSTETMHVMAEVLRRVYADRSAYVEDPRFSDVPVSGMTSPSYARSRYNDITWAEALPRDYRKTEAGNPLSFNGSGGGARRDRTRTAESTGQNKGNYRWDDVDEEGVSSYTRTPDELFNRWGGRAMTKASDDESSDSVLVEEEISAPKGKAGTKDDDDPPEGGHTTHLSVMDKDGNAVSLTQTLGTFFGSGVMAAGVLMNCSMTNFSMTTTVNAIEANKRPRSSIAPTILVRDGMPYLIVGSPGATRIIATVIELIVNVVDFGMTPDEANRAPRFLCQKNDDYLSLESGISVEVQEGLKQKGHRLKVYGDLDLFFGGAQLIVYDPASHLYYGSADPRRGGAAIGD